jgi:hypothetical protein
VGRADTSNLVSAGEGRAVAVGRYGPNEGWPRMQPWRMTNGTSDASDEGVQSFAGRIVQGRVREPGARLLDCG